MGTPSHVPLQSRAIIIAIFRSSGTNCMCFFTLGLGTELRLWSQFQIYLTGEFSSFYKFSNLFSLKTPFS